MNLKALKTNPRLYFCLTLLFYIVFESLNATLVCRSGRTTAITGLFSILGFWLLVATVVLTFKEKREVGRRSWLRLAIPALIIALFLFDFYLGRTCFY